MEAQPSVKLNAGREAALRRNESQKHTFVSTSQNRLLNGHVHDQRLSAAFTLAVQVHLEAMVTA